MNELAAPPPTFARVLGWVQLLRLSNAPTAVADVWAGFALVSGTLAPTPALAIATLASLAFYHGGMALNDAHDAERDAAEDRGRPIARGLVNQRSAFEAAVALLAAGVVLAFQTELFGRPWTEPFAVLLLVSVLLYDQPAIKKSVLGPPLMGLCRASNLLLGAGAACSASTPSAQTLPYGVAVGLFIYVAGVTAFARGEAVDRGRSASRIIGAAGCVGGLLWLAIGAVGTDELGLAPRSAATLLWLATAAFALRGVAAALLQPTPARVGRGVGIAIQGIIVIDATLATLAAGPMAGLAILALLPVTMLLSLWVPQT